MVFKKAATLFVRLGRTFLSRPLKPLFTPRTIPIQKTQQIFTKTPTKFYLFPSIYRTFFNANNPTPYRVVLQDIKRRLFFTTPTSTRFLLGFLGYSLVPQTPFDRFQFTEIRNFFTKEKVLNDNQEQDSSHLSLNDYELGDILGKGCNAVVYEAKLRTSDQEILNGKFNLAIKMLFNYDIQSNAESLRRAMNKELLPLTHSFSHPNMIRMYSSFVDSIPLSREALEHFPMAIPRSLVSEAYGRNKTLFIVMKKYDSTLCQYLQMHQPNEFERLLLFTQLIEGLLYLNQQSIVHRDLKSNNILICKQTGELVIADFGCALSHPPNLKVPYQTDAVSKGGNWMLMAPEIASCKPGPTSFLDYRKSDLWASGALFYEFFSQSNPFSDDQLKKDTYDDQNLPSILPFSSSKLEQLIHSILRKDPTKRPSVYLVSDALQICLWFKSLQSESELYGEFMWTALQTIFSKQTLNRVEFNLKSLFFQRQTPQTFARARAFLNEL